MVIFPCIDSIVGHWFARDVQAIFSDADGQFFLEPEERKRIDGFFLEPGQGWAVRDRFQPSFGEARQQDMLRAVHEAGHAVACIDQGIRVEFLTIVRGSGINRERLAYCQYDYHLILRDPMDDSTSAKVAVADLAGPIADRLYREANGFPTPTDITHAWEFDRANAKYRFAEPDADKFEGLDELVQGWIQEPHVWSAVLRIAEKLCDEGAISGDVAASLM
jgi:hypothetical protein